MFTRVLALLPFALLVAAGQCNTGSAKCCNSVKPSDDPAVHQHLKSESHGDVIGNVLGAVTVLVGLDCSPIVGTGANCQQQPVCCQGNTFSGLIGINCSPININL